MEPCQSLAELVADPVGRWLPTGSGLFWCHAPTLCGMAVWGRPTASETRTLLQIFDAYPRLAPRFDVLQDARAVASIDPDALAVLMDWMQRHPQVFRDHVRTRIAVIPPGLDGLALAGLAPALAIDGPVTITDDARGGFRALLPEGGDALADEVEGLIARVRQVSAPVLALRRALADARGALDLEAAARLVGISARSLQRELAAAGGSFRSEQADARFRAATELLRGDHKLVAVAAAIGVSEDGLTELVRARTGLTPGELRRRLRGG